MSVHDEWNEAIRAAEALGTKHGTNAGTWYETDDPDAVLVGIADGDPEILDTLPRADFSGQWADGYSPERLASDLGISPEPEELDILVDIYSDAFDSAAEAEVVRHLRAIGGSYDDDEPQG